MCMQLMRTPRPLAELPLIAYAPFTSSNNRNDKKIYNMHVPLPLAVGTIMSRADNRWYRTLPQMRTDINLIQENAALVYQEGHSVRNKAVDITRDLHRVLDSGDHEDERELEDALEEALAGTSEAGTSRAVLNDSPDVPATRRQTRGGAAVQVQPATRRETRRHAARAMSPEPYSPEDDVRHSRATRPSRGKRRMYSEDYSQEPIDRPRRNTRQRVATYA